MSSELKKRLSSACEGKKPSEVESLCLDQVKGLDGEGLKELEAFTNLVSLSIQDSELTSIDSLPLHVFSRLNTLKLNDNRIKAGLDRLKDLKELRKLYLASNKLEKNLEILKPLSSLENLELLDLEGNPVSTLEGYREFVWGLLPKLAVLDGKDKDGQEIEENEDDDESEDDDDEGISPGEGEDEGDEEDAGEEDDEEEGQEGEYEEYVNYGEILLGSKEAADDDPDDEDFVPKDDGEDVDIPEEDEDAEDNGDEGDSSLGKRKAEESEGGTAKK